MTVTLRAGYDPAKMGFVPLGQRRRTRLRVTRDGIVQYFCRRCGRLLGWSRFRPLANPKSRCGRMSVCKVCEDIMRAMRKKK